MEKSADLVLICFFVQDSSFDGELEKIDTALVMFYAPWYVPTIYPVYINVLKVGTYLNT